MKASREFRQKYPGIEIKRLGHQLVSPGSLHPSGKPYTWDMFGADMTKEGPPVVPPKLWAGLQSDTDSDASATAGSHRPEQIVQMLKHLDAENYRNREDWLDVMMSCHHATGGGARQEFIDWSTTDDWYAGDSESIGETWDSLSAKGNGGKPVTIATLFAELHKYGHGDQIIQGNVTADFEDVEEEPEDEFQTKIEELSLMSEIQYERVREAEAEQLDIRVSALDKEVKKARAGQTADQKKLINFTDVEPWPNEVDGAELLTEIAALVQRFIVCDIHVARAVSLWIAFTWLINEVQIAPLAIITAPEKRCGKSQLLGFISLLCYRPLIASNISSAAIYRVVETYRPTLIIDEADTFLKDNEEARGIINSGHTRQQAYVLRLVGDEHEPKRFSTWGAKAISGIGYLPETLMDRAVIFELRRKLPDEKVDRLRHAISDELNEFDKLKSRLARFAKDAAEAVRLARPHLPEELNDRAQDNWEPLIAIADHAGGPWPDAARKTALAISADKDTLSTSMSVQLLADTREILRSFWNPKLRKISTEDLLQKLIDDTTKPWPTYNRGRPLTPRQLARLLDPYGIKAEVLRVGSSTKRGYKTANFEDAFIRYLPPLDKI